MDTKQLREILEAQRNLYLKSGDNVLVVVTTSFKNAPIAEVLQGYEYEIIQIPDANYPGQEYNLNHGIFCGKTVGWIISNISLSHSIGSEMGNHGLFIISNPGITEDWLDVLNAGGQTCQQNADKIEKAIGGDVGGEIHIIAEDGTDLRLNVPRGNWIKEVGLRSGLGTNGLYREYATAPYDANGTFVLRPGDFLTNPINEVIEKITLVIRSNRVIDIKGGVQTGTLKKMLKQADNPLAFNLGEFAIGINSAKPKELKRSVVAEKLLGGIHIAIGTNSICLQETCPDIYKFDSGRYNAGVHIDAIKSGSSVFFKADENGHLVTLLKDGKLMV